VIQDAGWVGGQHRMARPYSQDLRDRVVSSVASGRTLPGTAALFGVSAASVVTRGAWCSLTSPPFRWGRLWAKTNMTRR
jgi:hypothetical protein